MRQSNQSWLSVKSKPKRIPKATIADFRGTMEPITELTSPEGRNAIEQFWQRHPELDHGFDTVRELQERAFPPPISDSIRIALAGWFHRIGDRIQR